MTAPGEVVELARLDQREAIVPDPAIWVANLAALRGEQPELAAELEQTALPADWRPVRALDGWCTYRLEQPGQPPAWLAGTAAPQARATGWLSGYQPGEHNPSLPGLGAGAELGWLLERLPDWRAVYVFEPSRTVLAAVLHVMLLARAITLGRCILVPPGREEPFVRGLLAAYPGLLPPGNIVCPPDVPAPRIEEVKVLCERVARETHPLRAAQRSELAVSPARVASAGDSPRLAIVALSPDATSRWVAAALTRAAATLGWDSVRCVVEGPRDVHLLTHERTLTRFSPSLVVCQPGDRDRLRLPPQAILCEWFTDIGQVPAQLPADGVWRLAATPRVEEALRAAAPAGGKIGAWYWGCAGAQGEDLPAAENVVFLVADWPDSDAGTCGIEQPSHKQLWKHLRQDVECRWESRPFGRGDGWLAHAEQATGIRLGEPALRVQFAQRVERILIPAVIAERIARCVVSAAFKIQAIGQGWQRWPKEEIEPLAWSLFELPDAGAARCPVAAIFAGRVDVFTPALLRAAELGWPLLIHMPPGHAPAAGMGSVLVPEEHFRRFRSTSELRTTLRSFVRDGEAARHTALRARRHLHAHHSYAGRLEQLRRLLQVASPAGMH